MKGFQAPLYKYFSADLLHPVLFFIYFILFLFYFVLSFFFIFFLCGTGDGGEGEIHNKVFRSCLASVQTDRQTAHAHVANVVCLCGLCGLPEADRID